MGSTKTIAEGRYLGLYERDDWEFAERPNAEGVVGILALTSQDEVILIEQFRRPMNASVIEIPAGLIGDEEAREISPAIKIASEKGLNVTGPHPADTIFNQAANGKHDVVLVMYHDQGHIAIKVYGAEESVTVNLGLPFLRTSVDHGTAFDIAAKGLADPSSMKAAIQLAIDLARKKAEKNPKLKK